MRNKALVGVAVLFLGVLGRGGGFEGFDGEEFELFAAGMSR